MEMKVLDFTASSTESSVKELITLLRPDWSREPLHVRVFTGGTTNVLYGVRREKSEEKETLLVRLFGEGSDLLVDRLMERKCIEFLQPFGYAEPVHASFNNGFVYGYVCGKPVTTSCMRKAEVCGKIARHMATIHSIPVPAEVSNRKDLQPSVLKNLRKWVQYVPSRFTDSTVEQQASAIPNREELQKEVAAFCDLLQTHTSPFVFCHNDLTAGNILVLDDRPAEVAFIDFEYAGWNLRCFDLGNLFCEYCGLEAMDFSLYPTVLEQMQFLHMYAERMRELMGNERNNKLMASAEELYREACMGCLASNLQWGLWGLVQAEHSQIDFNYIEYACTRLHAYFERKDSYLATALAKQ